MDCERADKIQLIREFVQNSIFNRNTEKINEFFRGILSNVQSNELELVEISRVYKKLAFCQDSESLLESLMELFNFLSFEQVRNIGKSLKNEENMQILGNLKNLGGEFHEILIKLKNITFGKKSYKIVQRIKNYESLRLDESGNCSHDCRKTGFINYNGLVFVDSNSDLRVQFFSLELEKGYEIDMTNSFKMKIKDLDTSSCTLEVFNHESKKISSETRKFFSSIKDLSKQFNITRVPFLTLKKRSNKWVLKNPVLLSSQKTFLMLKNQQGEEHEKSFFIQSGCEVYLKNFLYQVTYSYV
jgi:hypothetical protein